MQRISDSEGATKTTGTITVLNIRRRNKFVVFVFWMGLIASLIVVSVLIPWLSIGDPLRRLIVVLVVPAGLIVPAVILAVCFPSTTVVSREKIEIRSLLSRSVLSVSDEGVIAVRIRESISTKQRVRSTWLQLVLLQNEKETLLGEFFNSPADRQRVTQVAREISKLLGCELVTLSKRQMKNLQNR